MVVSNVNKFLALLWKNLIIEWSDVWAVTQINILPLLVGLFICLFQFRDIDYLTLDRNFDEALSIDNLELYKNTAFLQDENIPRLHLAYSPNTSTVFEEIVKAAATSLSLEYSGYADARDLETVMMKKKYLAGIEFPDRLAYITTYPEKLKYKLRFPNMLRKSKNDWKMGYKYRQADETDEADGGSPIGYLREGFLPVQNAISTAFIMQAAKDKPPSLPKIVLQRYPTMETYGVPISETFLIGIFGFITFLSMSLYVLKCVMEEKEKQLKEVMKIFGLQGWLQWLAWFVSGFMMLTVCTIYISAIMLVEWVDRTAFILYSSASLIIFFFVSYTIASLTMLFLATTFFSKSINAVLAMGVISWATFTLHYVLLVFWGHLDVGLILLFCLLPNVALSIGMLIIIAKELSGEGYSWSNMFTQADSYYDVSLGAIITMMILSGFLFMILCLYLEQIFPSEFGVPQKWNFPFSKSFWTGEQQYDDMRHMSMITRENPAAFEAEPSDEKIGLQVIKLSKKFDDYLAVDNVSLNLYENEVTALLGHNGAGKTTLISMLTGMIRSTSGTAIINGYDIRTNLTAARTSLSICPQHNILFDNLTVRQHLLFYGRLKGLQGNALNEEVRKYLSSSNLGDGADVKSSKLSGGTKRRLSVCAALCGGTKVVLLDEPSCSLDPAARRLLWDMIFSEKLGRTIVLTTHLMEEAEVLADRIAILSGGQLQCYGTPSFLKKKFGSGYTVICVKKRNCDSAEVTKLFNKHVPGIQPVTDIGTELSYRLPDTQSSKFKAILQDLETNTNRLNLDGYSISITSLEDVFMKVQKVKQGKGAAISFKNVLESNQNRIKGGALWYDHWRAMMLKKYLFTKRNVILSATQILMPIVWGILLFVFLTAGSDLIVGVQMRLDLLQFLETVTVLETKPSVKDDSLEAKISSNFKKIVQSLGAGHVLRETGDQSFIGFIRKLGETKQKNINLKYIAAATVDEGKITAWLNNMPFHAAPITVNLIHNAMARSIVGAGSRIDVINYPLPLTETSLNFEIEPFPLAYWTILPCIWILVPLYALFVVKERHSRAKLQQFIGSVRATTFWLSHFLYDLFTFTIITLILLIAIACCQIEGCATFGELVRIEFILILSGCALIPLIYLCAEMSDGPGRGYIIAISMLFFPIFICQNLATTMQTIDPDWLLLYPPYDLWQVFLELDENLTMRKNCPRSLKCTNVPFFAWERPGIQRHLLAFAGCSIILLVVLLLKDSLIVSNWCYWIHEREPPLQSDDDYFDKDVEREKDMVDDMLQPDIDKQTLVLNRVTKYYGHVLAVNQISLVVKESECFGLCGVNGAGKTSAFKLLIGEEKMSWGNGYVHGLSLRRQLREIYQDIGYCPQFDALLEYLTGREMLKIFCLIRGIPREYISSISNELAVGLGFMKYINKPIYTYSKGNKRKLSAAIAIMANPSLIYLDEPTTGMDPSARRHVWNVLCKIRDSGKSIVLTSHSMDECEALCTRLAIMVNGEFKCLGSVQHLKNTFTKGITLRIKVTQTLSLWRRSMLMKPFQPSVDGINENIERVKGFIYRTFPKSQLIEEKQGLLLFNITFTEMTWSHIFGILEANKAALSIEDYSMSQTTLEDVFLRLSKLQSAYQRIY